jgi:NAD(P)-dependent dehydrogenase (short-subunit alcohol dehydrogenase family)
MTRFPGKRILITGGSQGIGRACCEYFASEGAEVIGTYSRDEVAARATESSIRAAGHRAMMIKADLGDSAQIEALWKRATQDGGVDALILNAAYQKKATFEETDLALIEKTFRVNVGGNFQLAKLFIDARRALKAPGSVVIHSSNQGDFVNPTGFAYGMSKAALNHMVHHLARATVRDSIRVNGVLLGWFDTDGERKFYSAEQIKQQAKSGIPMGRAGDPKEAAAMAAFLVSDDSSYMTGSLVRFDGGFALDPDLST